MKVTAKGRIEYFTSSSYWFHQDLLNQLLGTLQNWKLPNTWRSDQIILLVYIIVQLDRIAYTIADQPNQD